MKIDARSLFWFEHMECGNEDCKRSRGRIMQLLKRCLEVLRKIKNGDDMKSRSWRMR